MHIQGFLQMFKYLLATDSIDIIARDFSYNLLKCCKSFKSYKYFHRPRPDNKKTNTYIWIFGRPCLYQKKL